MSRSGRMAAAHQGHDAVQGQSDAYQPQGRRMLGEDWSGGLRDRASDRHHGKSVCQLAALHPSADMRGPPRHLAFLGVRAFCLEAQRIGAGVERGEPGRRAPFRRCTHGVRRRRIRSLAGRGRRVAASKVRQGKIREPAPSPRSRLASIKYCVAGITTVMNMWADQAVP